MSNVEIYPFPSGAKPSPDYTIEVNGQPVWVGAFAAGAHAAFGLEGNVEVKIRPFKPCSDDPVVRPLSRNVNANVVSPHEVVLELDGPAQLYLEIPGSPDLMLFANPLAHDKPVPDDPEVLYFRAGRVHDAGQIELQSGQTLYIEGGAIVKGHVVATDAENVTIAGFGILDGRHYPKNSLRLVVFDNCRNVQVRDFCTVGTPGWNLVFGACEQVHVSGVKLIGWVVTSDGIDVVGCNHVHVEKSFFRNNDDCVAIKAVLDWRRDTRDVLVEQCVMYNDRAGNVLEIGYETSTESISDITFRDIDVIGAHGEGGVFTIHNGDRARVENVLYEDIRVEHFYDKFVDFRIMPSRYSKDEVRGHVRGVHLKNIRAVADRFNCVSLIGGYDESHLVEDVLFEDVRLGEKHILSADDLHLFEKRAANIRFS